MLTILSLFDCSGVWAGAFEQAGCNVVQVDLKLGQDIGAWSARSLMHDLLQAFPVIDGVIAAPPCTAFASSGAHAWKAKDADGRTAAAVHLVRQTLRVVDFVIPDFWALENPTGRIAKLVPELGAPALTFDPCDFAGWTADEADLAALAPLRRRGGELMADEIETVARAGAYTKRTMLWGHFASPQRRPVAPVRCTAQGSWLQALGGSGERTKAERSITPEGFAVAFAVAQLGASPEHLARCRRARGVQLTLGAA